MARTSTQMPRTSLDEQDGSIHSRPTFLAEVLSPANTLRKRQELLADYESIGVSEVWVISPDIKAIEVLHLDDGRLQVKQVATEGVLAVSSLSGVTIRVGDLGMA